MNERLEALITVQELFTRELAKELNNTPLVEQEAYLIKIRDAQAIMRGDDVDRREDLIKSIDEAQKSVPE